MRQASYRGLAGSSEQGSPFHRGEQEIQQRTGKREAMEDFGRRAIRSFMPDQHREFFAQLPFLVIGSVDEAGWPWASMLPGRPGFISSPDANTLTVDSPALAGDPLSAVIKKPGSPLGLLGIELNTRRRNRLNGRIGTVRADGFSLSVDQSFGNCPQYIRHRTVDFVREPGSAGRQGAMDRITDIDEAASTMIGSADTLFVSSFIQAEDRPEVEGVDVSHRGGRPGFVRVEGNTLTIPDYPGNYHFNTLGNFLVNPKAGLIFTDFTTGDILMLTGTVEVLWEGEPEVQAFKGSERAWRFTLDHGLRLANALPFRASPGDFSPNTLLTGDWAETEAILAEQARLDTWRSYRLARLEDESDVIRSFYFEPIDGAAILPFEAGQFLTIRAATAGGDPPATRTYTVSSAPGEPYYRISVKRELDGLFSGRLHGSFKPGDLIEAMAPRGDFFIDAGVDRPAVLIAGGVGITPMVSMALHVAKEGLRTRYLRPLTVLHSARSSGERAFSGTFRALEKQTGGVIRYFSFVSSPSPEEQPGVDYDRAGRITAAGLQQLLPIADYDFFLCGPAPFMQAHYDTLRGLGVPDARIHTEAFGPAAVSRAADPGNTVSRPAAESDAAVIRFTRSGVEQRWNAGDATLLETAEAHGLSPEFGCRNGACGTCAVRLQAGSVAYRAEPTASHAVDEVLICCAVPAQGTATLNIDL